MRLGNTGPFQKQHEFYKPARPNDASLSNILVDLSAAFAGTGTRLKYYYSNRADGFHIPWQSID
jgi:hypothetical protein